MDLNQIQHEIACLPEEQRTALALWLSELDRAEWDEQVERDFSAGGAGIHLLERVKEQVRRGESSPISDGQQGS